MIVSKLFSADDLPYDQRQEILEKHIETLQSLQVRRKTEFFFSIEFFSLKNERSSTIERCREEIHRMKIELDLNSTYDQPADDEDLLKLVDGPVHLIALSQTNVDRLKNLAEKVK